MNSNDRQRSSKSLLRAFFMTAMLWLSATAHAENLEPLRAWVGKYPSDHLSTKASLLQQAPVKAVLKQILPKAEMALWARLDVEAPVRESGAYLIIDRCLPHNCPVQHATLVIDTASGKSWAGFFSRTGQSTSTRWYGSADNYSVLPDDIQKAFLRRHGD